MILEIDAGNSRLKWRLCNGRQIVGRGIGDPANVLGLLDAVASHPAMKQSSPSRIKAVSVRGEAFERALLAAVSGRWGVLPEFARSEPVWGPVANGYERPSTLGADRWLAIVAGFDHARRACCVVDAGSAITLDLVAVDGRHEGGYIVPGLHLQRDSFIGKTGLQLEGPAAWTSVAPGLRTQAALDNGILAMVTGWVVTMMEANEEGGERALYLTGGDAPVLSVQLGRHNVPHLVIPDLVLDGLVLTLP